MKSKTSFCNKTIVKKDLTRLWPVWVVPTIALQIVYGLLLLSKYSYSGENYTKAQIKELICEQVARSISSYFMLFLFCGFAILCAVLVFQYLNRSTSAFLMHSFPVSRKCLFLSHALSGYLMLLIPFVLLFVMLGLFCLLGHIPMGLALLSYFLEMLFATAFFYSLAVLLTMFSGNSIMSIIMYTVMQALVYSVTSLLQFVTDFFSYGSHQYSSTQGVERIVTWMTPLLKMRNLFKNQYGEADDIVRQVNSTTLNQFFAPEIARFALYLIPAALCFFLALLLYKKRKMERVGETLVFSWSKVIFRFVFCFCVSLLFVIVMYFLGFFLLAMNQTYDTFYLCGLVLLVAGTIISYIVCDMILEKTFHVFKDLSWHMILLFCLVIGSIFVGNHYLNLQRGKVQADQLEKVRISVDVGQAASITAKAEMKQIIDFEKNLNKWANKQTIRTLDESSSYVSITYYYRNGGSATHNYDFVLDANKEAAMKLLTMLNDKNGILKRYELKDSDASRLSNLYVLESGKDEGYAIPSEYQAEVYDALISDLQAGHITVADFTDPKKQWDNEKNGIYNTKHVEWILSWMATFDQAKENDWDDYTDYNFDITKDATALNQWYAKRKADLIRYNETKTEEQ